MIQPWPTLHSEKVGKFHIFTVRSDCRVSPRTGAKHDFFVIDSPPWVNVVGLTPDRQVILVEQFRHGSETVELEVPGGVIDPKDPSPVAAGCRELREETGYSGENAQLIGEVFANPAIMNNKCYTVFVENCRPTGPLQLDSAEDCATRLVPMAQIPELVASGKFQHSLVVAAFYHFDLWLKKNRR